MKKPILHITALLCALVGAGTGCSNPPECDSIDYTWPRQFPLDDSGWGISTKAFLGTKTVERKDPRPVLKYIPIDWEPVRKGLKMKLIPLNKEYTLGKPMYFRVELSYRGPVKIIEYEATYLGPLIVTGPNGEAVTSARLGSSTAFQLLPLRSGETVTLIDRGDITQPYLITQPGKYSVQFHANNAQFGWRQHLRRDPFPDANRIPSSNIVTIDIKPGKLSAQDLLIQRLRSKINTLPGKWYVGRWEWEIGDVSPLGRKAGEGSIVHLESQKLKGERVIIWQMKEKADSEALKVTSEYLGECDLGHIYIHLRPAKGHSNRKAIRPVPDVRNAVAKALGIKH